MPIPSRKICRSSRVWPDEQRYFFDVVMASKDAWGGAICCGTSCRAALRAAHADQEVSDRFRDRGLSRSHSGSTRSVTAPSISMSRCRSASPPKGSKSTSRSAAGGRWASCRSAAVPTGPLVRRRTLRCARRVMLIETFLYWSATHAFRILGHRRAGGLSVVQHPGGLRLRSRRDFLPVARFGRRDLRHDLADPAPRTADPGRPQPAPDRNRYRQVRACRTVPAAGSQIRGDGQGRGSQQALPAMADAADFSLLPRDDGRGRHLGVRARRQPARRRCDRHRAFLELVQHHPSGVGLLRLYRGARKFEAAFASTARATPRSPSAAARCAIRLRTSRSAACA